MLTSHVRRHPPSLIKLARLDVKRFNTGIPYKLDDFEWTYMVERRRYATEWELCRSQEARDKLL